MRLRQAGLFLFVFCFSLNGFANGDVLLLKAIQQEPPNTLKGLPRPTRGMKMEEVRKVFGEPLSATKAIGNPPIIRWKYQGYVVYFEDKFVIDTVMEKPIAQAK